MRKFSHHFYFDYLCFMTFKEYITKYKISNDVDYICVGKNAQLTDLIGIGDFENLFDLDITNNKINDLTPLSGLKKLKVLRCGNNKIKNISCLKTLNLEKLFCYGNQISDLSDLPKTLNVLNCHPLPPNILDILSGLPNLYLFYDKYCKWIIKEEILELIKPIIRKNRIKQLLNDI